MRYRRAGLVAAVLLLWASTGVDAAAVSFPAGQNALTTLSAAPPSHTPSIVERNFGDLLGEVGKDSTTHAAEPASAEHTTRASEHGGGGGGGGGLENPLLGGGGGGKAATTALHGLLPLTDNTATSKTAAATMTTAGGQGGQGQAHSIIGTPPPTLGPPTYVRPTNVPIRNTVTMTESPTVLLPQTIATATATMYNGNNSGAVTMPGTPGKSPSATQWKIAGVAVSAVSVVAAGILSVVFFDQWWGFLKACCGRRKNEEGTEELVEEWETREWDKGRFPSFGTPPMQTTGDGGGGHGRGGDSASGYAGSGIQTRLSRHWDRLRQGPGGNGGQTWQPGMIAPAAIANAYGINGKHYSAMSSNLAGLGLNHLGVVSSPASNPFSPRSPAPPAPVLVRPQVKHAPVPVRPPRAPPQFVNLPRSSTTRSTFYAEDAYDGME